MMATNNNSYELLLPGNPASLAIIRWVVTRLATAAGLTKEAVDHVEVAVDEACTNVLDHAYQAMDPKPPLRMAITTSDVAFTVDILDRGKTFDYGSYTEPEFPDHWLEGHERGLGLYLIHQFVDDVQYETLPGHQNRMRLIKRRNVAPPSAPTPDEATPSEIVSAIENAAPTEDNP